ncbi:MAG: hypothetical protein ACQEXJ_18805 [Myxococcota bacterium]
MTHELSLEAFAERFILAALSPEVLAGALNRDLAGRTFETEEKQGPVRIRVEGRVGGFGVHTLPALRYAVAVSVELSIELAAVVGKQAWDVRALVPFLMKVEPRAPLTLYLRHTPPAPEHVKVEATRRSRTGFLWSEVEAPLREQLAAQVEEGLAEGEAARTIDLGAFLASSSPERPPADAPSPETVAALVEDMGLL